MKTAIVLAALVALSGCMSAFVPVLNPDDLTPARVAASQRVRIFEAGESYPDVAAELEQVTGYSCRQKMWEPSATPEAALRALRIRAADLGGDGVIRVTYATHKSGLNFRTNCWSAVRAEGMAVRFTSVE